MNPYHLLAAFVVGGLVLAGTIKFHNDPAGKAHVTDGDTLRVAGQAVRLFGVDAEELNEPHGDAARWEMWKIAGGLHVTCKDTGQRSYNRIVAECFLDDGTNVNAEIIRRGFALDCAHYSGGKYRALEPPGARARLIQKGYC